MYDKIINFENLYRAYRKVRLLKRHYPSQQKYEFNLETNLCKLHLRLRDPQKYKPKPYRKFTIYEPKMRGISAPHFEDRIVHQAIVRIIEPDIIQTYIPTSYACIKERGTHKAVKDLRSALEKLGDKDTFYFKADMRRYFASVDHTVLKRLLRQYLHCEKTLMLLDKIVDSYEDPPHGIASSASSIPRGIPIGNLTSQLFANLYLSELDHFVDSPSYFRYMDDFVILAKDKDKLISLRNRINNFLHSTLKLKLHPRKQLIQRISFGIEFCGYNIYADKVILRKKTLRRFVRRFKRKQKRITKLQREIDSYLLPEFDQELADKIAELKEELNRSVVSHLGFLKYSEIGTGEKDYGYVNKIRLPYLPKKCDR